MIPCNPQRREERVARCAVCPLRVFRVCNKVADSGDVAIQEQDFSIFDTREPAIAMPQSPIFSNQEDAWPHKNRIYLVGRHQEVCRFAPPGLHHITSVSCSHWGVLHKVRHTSTVVGLFHLNLGIWELSERRSIGTARKVMVERRRGTGGCEEI
jgi:hypothetical protein